MKCITPILSALSFLLLAGSLGCDAQTGGTAARRQAAAPSQGGTRAFELPDPALGMNAATVHVPAGWGFAGVVVHANNCVIGGHSMQINTESADGLTGLMMLPTLVGMGATNPQVFAQARQQGCTIVTSEHAADFIKTVILPHVRPGARVISVAEEPEFAEKVQAMKAQAAQLRQQMPPVQNQFVNMLPPTIESARVRIAYQRNGHEEEEFVSTVTACNVTQYRSMRYAAVQCTAEPIVLLHAPAGQLDALAAKKDSPFRMDYHADWQKRMEQVVQAENQQQMQQAQAQQNAATAKIQANANANLAYINGAAARSQANADVINRQGAAVLQSARNSQAAIDHSAQATAQSMGDRNVYSSGSGTQYTGLSNQYSHTYDNGQGLILQTNSAYAPGGGQVWTELTPKY